MNVPIPDSQIKRQLLIDFALYTDGDPDFKKELITLMIENIHELVRAQRQAEYLNNLSLFLKACHKVNSTLNILNDIELNKTVHQLSVAAEAGDAATAEQVIVLHGLCDKIVKSLEQERNTTH